MLKKIEKINPNDIQDAKFTDIPENKEKQSGDSIPPSGGGEFEAQAAKFEESLGAAEDTVKPAGSPKISKEDRAYFGVIEAKFEGFKNDPELKDKSLKYNVGDSVKAPLPPEGLAPYTGITTFTDQESEERIDWTIVKAESGHYLLEMRTDSEEAPVHHVICDENDLERWGNKFGDRDVVSPETEKPITDPEEEKSEEPKESNIRNEILDLFSKYGIGDSDRMKGITEEIINGYNEIFQAGKRPTMREIEKNIAKPLTEIERLFEDRTEKFDDFVLDLVGGVLREQEGPIEKNEKAEGIKEKKIPVPLTEVESTETGEKPEPEPETTPEETASTTPEKPGAPKKKEGFFTRAEKFLEKSTIGKKLLGQEVESGTKAEGLEKATLITSKVGDIASSMFGVRLLARLPDRTLKRIYSKREIVRIKGALSEEANLRKELTKGVDDSRKAEIEAHLGELGLSEKETKSDRVNRRMAEIEKRLNESKYLSEEKRAKLKEKLESIRASWSQENQMVETDMTKEVDSVLNQFVGDRMKKRDVLKESFDMTTVIPGAYAIRAVGRGAFGLAERYANIKSTKKEGEKVKFLKEIIYNGAKETAQEMFGQGKLKEVKGIKKTFGIMGAWGKAAIPAAIAIMGYSQVAEKGGHAFTKAFERAGERAGEISEAWSKVSNPGEAIGALLNTLNLQESAHRLSLGLIGKEDAAAGAAEGIHDFGTEPVVPDSTATAGGIPEGSQFELKGPVAPAEEGHIKGLFNLDVKPPEEPVAEPTMPDTPVVPTPDQMQQAAVSDATATGRTRILGELKPETDIPDSTSAAGAGQTAELGKARDVVPTGADKAAVAAAATAEAVKEPVTMSIELGQEGGPQYVEQAFYRVAIDDMKLGDQVTNVEGARILNVGANLRELSEGHGVSGISPEEFSKYVEVHGDKITITDYEGFKANIVDKLIGYSQEIITENNVADSGAVAYLDNIKNETWMEMLKPKGIGEGGIQFDHGMIDRAEGRLFQDTLDHSGIGKIATNIHFNSESSGSFDIIDQHIVVDHGQVMVIGEVKLDQPIELGTKQAGDQLVGEAVKGMKIEMPKGELRTLRTDLGVRPAEVAPLETISKEGVKALDDLEKDITRLIHSQGHGQKTLGLTLEQIRSPKGQDLLTEALKADGGHAGRADNIQREVLKILNNSEAVNQKQTMASFLMNQTDDETVKSAITSFVSETPAASEAAPAEIGAAPAAPEGAAVEANPETPAASETASVKAPTELEQFMKEHEIKYENVKNGNLIIKIYNTDGSADKFTFENGKLIEVYGDQPYLPVQSHGGLPTESNASAETEIKGAPAVELSHEAAPAAPPENVPVSVESSEAPLAGSEITGIASPEEVNLALENLAGGIKEVDKLSIEEIRQLDDVITLTKLKNGSEDVLRAIQENPPEGVDPNSLQHIARGYKEVLGTIDSRLNELQGAEAVKTAEEASSVAETGAGVAAAHEVAGEHLGTFETPDGKSVTFQYDKGGKVIDFESRGGLGSNESSLNPDFQEKIIKAIDDGKLKINDYDRAVQQVIRDGRYIDNEKSILESMEKIGKGNTPEAELIRNRINLDIEKAEKFWGDVFK